MLPYSASIEEVTRLTGLSETKFYALLAEGKLRGQKHGRRTMVTTDGVRTYFDELPRAQFGGVARRADVLSGPDRQELYSC